MLASVMRFRAAGATGAVPSTAWLPDGDATPIVLLGHGGSTARESARHERLARWFTDHGIAALAIDGPFHGERVEQPRPAHVCQRLMATQGSERILGQVTHDWLAAVDHLGNRVDRSRCGYIGLSLGARLGIPLAAALGERLRCLVVGKFGLTQSDAFPPGLATPELHHAAAQRITAPLMFSSRCADELFPFTGALELFAAFGSSDKVMLARPGAHTDNHPDDERAWREFVHRHLTADAATPVE